MSNRFEQLARWGYASRGVVYVVLGVMAVSGVTYGAEQGSQQGALSALLAQPFGRVLLAAVKNGLVGHVLWRLAQSLLDADGRGTDLKGLAARAGYFCSALANGALALAAAQMVFASGGGSGGGEGEESAASWLMQQPFGRFLVAAVGIALLVSGGIQVWRGLAGKYRERVHLPAQHEKVLGAISAAGLSARGVLLAITGGFFLYAALVVDPQQAGGLTEALDWVRDLPFGGILYSLAAIGLIAFGLYSFIEARYRQVEAPDNAAVTRAAAQASSALRS